LYPFERPTPRSPAKAALRADSGHRYLTLGQSDWGGVYWKEPQKMLQETLLEAYLLEDIDNPPEAYFEARAT